MKIKTKYAAVVAVSIVCSASLLLGLKLRNRKSNSHNIGIPSESSSPTLQPSIYPTAQPISSTPTASPTIDVESNFTVYTEAPTGNFSTFENVTTISPSNQSSSEDGTISPTANETQTSAPSHPYIRSSVPSSNPSLSPSRSPTAAPSLRPSTRSPNLSRLPTSAPTVNEGDRKGERNETSNETRFYAIGDVPYSAQEASELLVQMQNLPSDAEFLIHVGDIRSARHGGRCEEEEYMAVADILKESKVPVFLVVGDNEWNDCPNVNQGYDHWVTVFGNFDAHWDHSISVERHENRTENFHFVHKQTLFIGLNLVGGRVHHKKEWEERHEAQAEWVKQLVTSVVVESPSEANNVVLFAHANPNSKHDDFFDPLQDFLEKDLENSVPFLYLSGDGHKWLHTENFFDQSSFLRMQVEGGTRNPPLQITVQNDASLSDVADIFAYDRMMGIEI